MTSETKLKPQEVSKKPPENKPFVTGLIVTFLMILSFPGCSCRAYAKHLVNGQFSGKRKQDEL